MLGKRQEAEYLDCALCSLCSMQGLYLLSSVPLSQKKTTNNLLVMNMCSSSGLRLKTVSTSACTEVTRLTKCSPGVKYRRKR